MKVTCSYQVPLAEINPSRADARGDEATSASGDRASHKTAAPEEGAARHARSATS